MVKQETLEGFLKVWKDLDGFCKGCRWFGKVPFSELFSSHLPQSGSVLFLSFL